MSKDHAILQGVYGVLKPAHGTTFSLGGSKAAVGDTINCGGLVRVAYVHMLTRFRTTAKGGFVRVVDSH